MAYTVGNNVLAQSPDGNGLTSGNIDTSGANTLVGIFADYTGSSPTTISDSKSNIWNMRTSYANTVVRVRIGYAFNATVGSGHNFTAAGAVSFVSFIVVALNGGDISSPYDVENGASGTSPISTGSVTPGSNDEILLTGIGLQTSNDYASTAPSGYTLINYGANIGSAFGVSLAYLIQTTAGASNPSWTAFIGTALAANIATFKSAAAGGSSQVGRLGILGVN